MNILPNYIIEALGACLLHSLWQGLLISTVLLIILKIGKNSSPQFKYHTALASLLGLTGWMAWTFISYLQYPVYIPIEQSSVLTGNLTEIPLIIEETSWRENLISQFSLFASNYSKELVMFWCIGVILFGTKWLGAWYYTKRLKHHYTKPIAQQWQVKIEKLSYDLGIRKIVRIMESTKADVPMVIGFLKPVILIPSSAICGCTPEQLESVIVHELAHIKHNDFLINLIISALEVMLFYHPAYWYFIRVITLERENRCDDLAVRHLGNPRLYAETLFNMEKMRQQRSLGLALQGKKNQLLERIQRICMNPKAQYRRSSSTSGFAFGLLLLIAVMSLYQIPLEAQENEPFNDIVNEELNEKYDATDIELVSKSHLTKKAVEELSHTLNKVLVNAYSETPQYVSDNIPLYQEKVLTPSIDIIEKTPLELIPEPVLEIQEIPILTISSKDSIPNEGVTKIIKATVNEDGSVMLIFNKPGKEPYRKLFIENKKGHYKINGKKMPKENTTYYLNKGDKFSISGKMEIYDLRVDNNIKADDIWYNDDNIHIGGDENSVLIKQKDGEISISSTGDGTVSITRKSKEGKVLEERIFGVDAELPELPELLELPELPELPELFEDNEELLKNFDKETLKEIQLAREEYERAIAEYRREMTEQTKAFKEQERAMAEQYRAIAEQKRAEQKQNEKSKKMNRFQDELLDELKNDKLIKNKKKVKFILTNDMLKVNGKKQPSSLHQKYLAMYQQYKGEKVGPDSRFEWRVF